MKNRKYNGQYFESEYLNLGTTIKNENIQEEELVDFYIFLDKDKEFRGKNVHFFHTSFSFIKDYINSYHYTYNGNEPFQAEVIHQELLDCLDDSKDNEEIYILFIHYLTYGMRFRFSINDFTDNNFGVLVRFDDELNLTEKLIIDPKTNQSYRC